MSSVVEVSRSTESVASPQRPSFSVRRFSAVADVFGDLPLEKACDWATGYLPAFKRDLQLDLEDVTRNGSRRLLDYGCGKGAVANVLTGVMGVGHVHGVDVNAVCLHDAAAAAAAAALAQKVTFSQLPTGLVVHPPHHYPIDGAAIASATQPPPLARDEFDGAMCNFVISHLKTRAEQLHILQNMWTALQPGAPLVVLVNNPATYGTRFSSLQVGEADERFTPGKLVRVQMFRFDTGHKYLETRDRWWPVAHYTSLLEEAGFSCVRAEERRLEHEFAHPLRVLGLELSRFDVEHTAAPVLAVRGVKPTS